MTDSRQSQDGTAVPKNPDDGQRRCPKHVEFYNRINLDNQCVWLVI
jgi:hypothetical protein